MPATDMFWGDRFGQVRDPFGHVWSIATHKQDLSPEEMAVRGKEAMAQMAPPAPAKPKAKAKKKAAGWNSYPLGVYCAQIVSPHTC